MEPVRRGPRLAITDRVAALERSVQRIAQLVDDGDEERRFVEATALASSLQRAFESASAARAEYALRVRERENLSLSELADRLSLKKATVAGIIRAAERRRRGE